jgi:Ser/Thr protein kinase RdoA (MazF antagonist)
MVNNLFIENYMQERSLNCPKILLSSENKLMINTDENRAFLMTFINGEIVPQSSISDVQLYNLGHECGYMHLLFQNVDNKIYSGRYLKLPTINELIRSYKQKESSSTSTNLLTYVDLLKKQKEIISLIQETNIIEEIPICITHGDFAADNILFVGDKPYIVDFELVRENSYLQDIGRILMSYSYENGNLNVNKIKKFIEGYNTVKPLSEKDVLLSFMTVWINEVDMWIKENYFNKAITNKAQRFQDELIYITYNFENLLNVYISSKKMMLENYKNVEVSVKDNKLKSIR